MSSGSNARLWLDRLRAYSGGPAAYAALLGFVAVNAISIFGFATFGQNPELLSRFPGRHRSSRCPTRCSPSFRS
jgi:hypothetical protein